jgi:hypothetical protein
MEFVLCFSIIFFPGTALERERGRNWVTADATARFGLYQALAHIVLKAISTAFIKYQFEPVILTASYVPKHDSYVIQKHDINSAAPLL